VFPLNAVQVRQGNPPVSTRSPSAAPSSMRRAV
jgi:hypothetical protein